MTPPIVNCNTDGSDILCIGSTCFTPYLQKYESKSWSRVAIFAGVMRLCHLRGGDQTNIIIDKSIITCVRHACFTPGPGIMNKKNEI